MSINSCIRKNQKIKLPRISVYLCCVTPFWRVFSFEPLPSAMGSDLHVFCSQDYAARLASSLGNISASASAPKALEQVAKAQVVELCGDGQPLFVSIEGIMVSKSISKNGNYSPNKMWCGGQHQWPFCFSLCSRLLWSLQLWKPSPPRTRVGGFRGCFPWCRAFYGNNQNVRCWVWPIWPSRFSSHAWKL